MRIKWRDANARQFIPFRRCTRDVEQASEMEERNWELVHTFSPGYAAEFGEDGSLHVYKPVEGKEDERAHVEDRKPVLSERLAAINRKHNEFYRRKQ